MLLLGQANCFQEQMLNLELIWVDTLVIDLRQQKIKKVYYTAKVKINGHQNEQFTQTQVNDYITESILLGDDEEEFDHLL